MTKETLIKELSPIIRRVFQNEELVITDDMSANNVATWTSLSFMQLLAAIEEKYGFKFKMVELLKLKDMGTVLDTVLNRIG